MGTDWGDWPERYLGPRSLLAARLVVVRGFIREVLSSRDGPGCRIVSLCAGKGLDLLPVLSELTTARTGIVARLVELDGTVAGAAQASATSAGLAGVEVVVADAGLSDVFLGAVPADLVLVCGVFGNISDRDVRATVFAGSRCGVLVSSGSRLR